MGAWILGLLLCLVCLHAPRAQLAITEVLPGPSLAPEAIGADYWELTNFGDQPVWLNEYFFSDNGGFRAAINLAAAVEDPWLPIGPGESIVFARLESVTLPAGSADFRRWWGTDQLAPGLRVGVIAWDFGFSAVEDDVMLWHSANGVRTLVDLLPIRNLDNGKALAYDPVTGLRDRVQLPGIGSAFQAALTTDVGSPGTTTGPVPLFLARGPAATEVDAGSPVTLTALAYGLPRPQYQWRFNGQPIAGATDPSLTIPTVGPGNAGEYSVAIENGLSSLVTPAARLTVNAEERAVTIIRAPVDIDVTPGQTAVFRVEFRGYPVPEIQWQFNGNDIWGANSNTLSVPNCTAPLAGIYTVQLANPFGATNASARLRVVLPPRLRITEAMATPSTNGLNLGHNDWWELTNLDTYTVNLKGYRFNDKPGSLAGAVVVDRDVLVAPGRSVLWISDLSPDAFRRWWGEEHLPQDVEIITYNGNGFSSVPADSIRLWNATATEDSDFIDSMSFINDTPGVSLRFDEADCRYGCPSVLGEHGAFRAAESDDIGSPGWTSNEQRVIRPRILQCAREAGGLRITWKAQAGRRYAVQIADQPTSASWTTATTVTAASVEATAVVPAGLGSGAGTRYFRVSLFP